MVSKYAKVLGYLQIFIGMSAIAGGIPMIISPDGSSQGLSTDILANSPFKNYLIPGIFLVFVNGVGSLIASGYSLKLSKRAAVLGMFLGAILIFWILIQIYLIGFVTWLQPLYLAIGTVELLIAIRLFKQNRSGEVAS